MYEEVINLVKKTSVNVIYKGMFADDTVLIAKYPVGQLWWQADVVTTDTAWYWNWTNWTDSWNSIDLSNIITDSKYKIRDIDDSSQTTYTYFGKQTASGAYQIMRLTNATNTFEYAYWTSDYATAWTGRAALSYWNVQ